MTYICTSERVYHRFRWCLMSCSILSYHLEQFWYIINWTLGNNLHWNLHENARIFIRGNKFGNVVCKSAGILGLHVLTPVVVESEYFWKIDSMPWLLMHWLLVWQDPQNHVTNGSLSSVKTDWVISVLRNNKNTDKCSHFLKWIQDDQG